MSGGGVKFVQQDIQGSMRCVTSISGNVIARMDYQAFGEQIPSNIGQRTALGFASSDSVRQRYALTENDTATGLNDTWWRKLENRSGRWTSPDPYNGSMSLGNPQSFNRNSYVQNDPVNFIDPTGLLAAVHYVCFDIVTYSHPSNDPSGSAVHTETVCFVSGGGPDLSGTQGGEEIGGGGGGMPQGDDCDRALRNAGKTRDGLSSALQHWEDLLTAAHGDSNVAALLAAIGIKESNFQNVRQNGGGKGRGVFQIDLGQNPGVSEEQAFDVARAASWAQRNVMANYSKALDIGITPIIALGVAVYSYNAGLGRMIRNGKSTSKLDSIVRQNSLSAFYNQGTTDPDYVTDILDIYMNCF